MIIVRYVIVWRLKKLEKYSFLNWKSAEYKFPIEIN